MLARNYVFSQHLGQSRQVFIRETSSALRDRLKRIRLLIISSKKQRPISPRTFSPTVKSADHHKVHRILHLTLVIPLVLYPQPPTRSSLVNRVLSHGFANKTLTTISNSFLKEFFKRLHIADYTMLSWTQSVTLFESLLKRLLPNRIRLQRQVPTIDIQRVEHEKRHRIHLHGFLNLVLAPAMHQLLKRPHLTRFNVNRHALTLQNRLLRFHVILYEFSCVGVLVRNILQTPRVQSNFVSFLVRLYTLAIVLVLRHAFSTKLLQNFLGGRKPLRQHRPHRLEH